MKFHRMQFAIGFWKGSKRLANILREKALDFNQNYGDDFLLTRWNEIQI